MYLKVSIFIFYAFQNLLLNFVFNFSLFYVITIFAYISFRLFFLMFQDRIIIYYLQRKQFDGLILFFIVKYYDIYDLKFKISIFIKIIDVKIWLIF